jgi:AcrR family transcriptional regulator
MRYRPGHKSRTRERILATARKLFETRGFAEISIEDVMRACGLTRGGFYAHFSSKAELYREATGRSPEEPRPLPYSPLPFWAPTAD